MHRFGPDLAVPELGKAAFIFGCFAGIGRCGLLSPLRESSSRVELVPEAGLAERLLGGTKAESGRHDGVNPAFPVSLISMDRTESI